MNIFNLFPEFNEKLTKIAAQLDTEDKIFAFDTDTEADELAVGDIFRNRMDDRLYKVAAIELDGGQHIVQASEDFELSGSEFNELMEKLARSDDAEARHAMGDALLVFALKQAAPEFSHGADVFEGMDKWYA